MEIQVFIELFGAFVAPQGRKEIWVLCPFECKLKIFVVNGSLEKWK